MEFGQYEERPQVEGDRLQAQQITDTPLLVFVADFKPEQKSQYSAELKDAIFVDCMNLNTGEIYSHVLWMGGAVVDNLKPFLGQAVGVKLVYRNPKQGGKPYIIPVPLEGEEAQRAYQWAVGDPTIFERARTEKDIPQAGATQQAATGLTAATTPPQAPAAPTPPQAPPAPQAPAAPTPPPAAPAPPAPQAAAPTPPAAPQAPQAPAAPTPPQAPPAPQAAPQPPAAPAPPQAPAAPTPPATPAAPTPPQAPQAPQAPVNVAEGADGGMPF